LTGQIKRLLEQHVGAVWVSGEITNLRHQSSGHSYFTLKDSGAQLNCVLFRGEAARSRALLEDGRKVLLHGDLTVYEPRGQYQLIVHDVELQGMGALQIAFEKLKQRLSAEGLFAPERKRPLPRFPQRIGLVTSPTGAAIRDVLHVIQRRNPALEIVLAPCRVQGDGAAGEIATAIRLLNDFSLRTSDLGLDLILVTRGGGSLEDLWAFNEEVVARAIFESALPVVSAVGHEIDFTISDFVADLRAATPSAAAELITEGAVAARDFVSDARARLPRLARDLCANRRGEVEDLLARIGRSHPQRRVNDAWQRLDDLVTSLVRSGRFRLREFAGRQDALLAAWKRVQPAQRVAREREVIARAQARLEELGGRHLAENRRRLTALQDRLRLLSPEQTLARGYSITTDAATGRILRDTNQVRPGQRIRSRLKTGELRSVVE
jgi:exodeoxyribonuclease VII large subunit